uniref:Secreted protein n=1 Tax=Setaria viridis TaxID=4556 RepID=A0A4U6W1T4_SETVI|nr:hypothetical protein SEVIR_2G373500v2 [Setaria viridis]
MRHPPMRSILVVSLAAAIRGLRATARTATSARTVLRGPSGPHPPMSRAAHGLHFADTLVAHQASHVNELAAHREVSHRAGALARRAADPRRWLRAASIRTSTPCRHAPTHRRYSPHTHHRQSSTTPTHHGRSSP